MRILVGLGNPGKKYQSTRHNIGFIMADYIYNQLIAANFSNWQKNKKFQAEIATGQLNNEKIILAKPLTFMNNSGDAVQALMHFYKIPPLDLIIIHDDIDLEFGQFKIQENISSAGHNGIKSIIEKINTQKFWRVRIGIAKKDKEKQGDTSKYVLNNFSFLEKLKLKELKIKVFLAVLDLLKK